MEKTTKKKQNKKIVAVTGGCGFIGSALLRRLVPRYPQISFVNIDDLREGSNKESVSNLEGHQNYFFEKVAVENMDKLWEVLDRHQVTDIIHLAADSDVDNSIKFPLYTTNVNITGTLFLLEAAKKLKKFNRFVYVSTDEVYGDVGKSGDPKKEGSRHVPSSPYSASKSAAEGFVTAYNRTYGIDAVITRGSNTFGQWQDYTKLIPLAVKNLAEGKRVGLYGDGTQEREWLPVDLHAEGIEKVWLDGVSGEAYNIGTGVYYKNVDLVEVLIGSVGAPDDSYEFIQDRAGHDTKYSINNTKLRLLGWPVNADSVSRESVDKEIVKTALWYYQQNKS